MKLISTAFEHKSRIPPKYTCDGDNISPPLIISGVPEAAKVLVLIMDDPDVPAQVRPDRMWVHWVTFNISPTTTKILKGQDGVGTGGHSSYGKTGYGGPCPPPQYEPTEHRYYFKLYALDTELDLPEGATKADVEAAMQEHVIKKAELIGRYERV